MVRTAGFQSVNRGSIPRGATNKKAFERPTSVATDDPRVPAFAPTYAKATAGKKATDGQASETHDQKKELKNDQNDRFSGF